MNTATWVNENTGDLYCSEKCARKSNPKAGSELHSTAKMETVFRCDRCNEEVV